VKSDAEWVNMARTLFNSADTSILKVLKTYTHKAVREAVTSLIVATKINWFSTNHHVGQGTVTIFVQKAITVLFRGALASADQKELATTVHKIGHWASTHVVLDLMQIRTPRAVGILPYSWFDQDSKREVLRTI
jgi:hypothetical protein